jgi:hypothetical protein
MENVKGCLIRGNEIRSFFRGLRSELERDRGLFAGNEGPIEGLDHLREIFAHGIGQGGLSFWRNAGMGREKANG